MKSEYDVIKQGAKALDFVTLLVGRILPHISKKMTREIDYVNYLIDKNIEKLKSLSPVLRSTAKQYDMIFSSQMVLVMASANIHVSRSKFVKNNSKDALEKLNVEFDRVLSNLDTLVNGIEYFSALYNPDDHKQPQQKNKDKKSGGDEVLPEVKNIGDVLSILKKVVNDLKNKYIPEIKKKTLGIVVEGGSPYKRNYYTTTEILGGAPPKSNYREIVCGGGNGVVIVGGYNVDERRTHTLRIVHNWIIEGDPVDYFQKVIYHQLWGSGGLFPIIGEQVGMAPIDTYRELIKVCSSYNDWLPVITNIDHAYKKQLSYVDVKKFSEYINNHSMKYLDKPYEGVLDGDIMTVFSRLLDDLDKIDTAILEKHDVANSTLVGYRQTVKNMLHEKLRDYAKCNVPTLPRIICPPGVSETVFLSKSPEKQIAIIIDYVRQMLEGEKSMYPILQDMETVYDSQAILIGEIINSKEYNELIGPGIVTTCILKEINARQQQP
jgi:hypothetical protein